VAFHPSRPEDLRGFCREFTNKQIKNVFFVYLDVLQRWKIPSKETKRQWIDLVTIAEASLVIIRS
jgi:hypothetical protein